MNKIILFLMVLVVVARGAIYIYEKNKSDIDKFVSKPKSPDTRDTFINELPTPVKDKIDDKELSPFTLTFLLTDKGIYYYTGKFNGNVSTIGYSSVGYFIKAYKGAIKPGDLMFIIKTDKSASLQDYNAMMDEMEENEVPAGHYVERNITAREINKIRSFK